MRAGALMVIDPDGMQEPAVSTTAHPLVRLTDGMTVAKQGCGNHIEMALGDQSTPAHDRAQIVTPFPAIEQVRDVARASAEPSGRLRTGQVVHRGMSPCRCVTVTATATASTRLGEEFRDPNRGIV